LFLLGAWNTARHLVATLNWRRDPGYEQRMNENQIAIERSKERIKQIESEILQVRNDSERIEKDTEQIKKETKQLRQENSREKALSASIKRLCFPPESSSTLQVPIEPGSKPFLPS
jgi:septal ring factor EnvC (AmiA/AmiB activator)